jgi:hypothetical protein
MKREDVVYGLIFDEARQRVLMENGLAGPFQEEPLKKGKLSWTRSFEKG